MSLIDDFVTLSHAVGEPTLDAAILGEGNTSVKGENDTFYVKASGCSLGTLGSQHAVHLKRAPIMALLDQPAVDEAALQAAYKAAKVDQNSPFRPSVEAVFHALLLGYPGVGAVAHVHPTAVNGLTCSRSWPLSLAGRLCPDEAVVLGPDSVFIDYVDPGAELGKRIRAGVDAYRAVWGLVPKVIYMQNHGVIAVGNNVGDAINIVHMAIKAARMRLMAMQAGGMNPLPKEVISHLLGRPDEKYRQQLLAGKG